mgnify:CR=1 FL=1
MIRRAIPQSSSAAGFCGPTQLTSFLELFKALGADKHLLALNRHSLQVWLPNFPGSPLRVRNIMAVLTTFTANLTTKTHGILIYMIFELFTNPILFFIWLIALVIAVSIHEFSHSWMADRLGDPTPRINNRLTLNPLSHLDPVGTLMLLLVGFGWGKPVPIDPYNLENPRRDSALISLAGPASNLILATILSLINSLINYQFIALFLYPTIVLNVTLAIFNLLPFPPLDGSKILLGFLPADLASEWEEIFNRYGIIIIFFLIFPLSGRSLVSQIISPIINFVLNILI